MSEVSGKLIKIKPEEQVTNTFKKREAVIETDEQYPQKLLIEFPQDKTSLLDNYKEGDKVKVGINLRGREWTSPQGEVKYFNSIHGWRIEKLSGVNTPSASQSTSPSSDDDQDDLPF